MEDIIKIVKYLEESGVLKKMLVKQVKNKSNKQKDGLISMLFGKLGTMLLGNLFSGKRV